jgi:type II restriction enzyme
LLQSIPQSGRIAIIRNGVIEPKAVVLDGWQRTLFLRKQRDLEAKGWLVHVMKCIEQIGKSRFSLDEVYAFEDELKAAYPGNQGCSTLSIEFPVEERIGSGESGSISILTEC